MQKFNLYNFTSDNQMKVALTGVYHDSGYKVACDAIVMAAVKADYPEDLEHHIIGKDGQDIPAKYPRWKVCIPDGYDYQPYRIDLAKYEAFIKERRAAHKAETGHGIRWRPAWIVKVGPAYLRASNFDKFVSGMKEIGATEMLVRDERRTVYAKTDKGWMLLFPIIGVNEEENDPNILILS